MKPSAELRGELLRSCAAHLEGERAALPLLAGVLALAAAPSTGVGPATLWFVAVLLLGAGLHGVGSRIAGRSDRAHSARRIAGFTALRATQSALWGSLALLASAGSPPSLQAAWLFLVGALLVVFSVAAAPLPRLALAQAAPLFAIALYLATRQTLLPLLPYVAGFAPALAMLVDPLRRAAIRDAESRLALVRARAEAEAANRELAVLAATDELTRVPNRRAFLGRAAQELARARRHGQALSLMMVDVDHFKGINDRHGHNAGDEILRVVADLLSDALRETDLLARFGGDEFALLLPETPSAGAEVLAERLREALEKAQIHAAGESVAVTLSCGITSYRDGDSDIETLVERADRALYRAKRGGRNRIEVHPEGGADTGG